MSHNQVYKEILLEQLKFDPNNPRLPSHVDGRSDLEVIEWMLGDASLAELMLAIGTNGFFPGEPLLVTSDKSDSYTVVEGNRRLASLKLLNKNVPISKSKNKVEQVLKVSSHFPNTVPCIEFEQRCEIEKYLGFRHITGIREWSPLSKAKYLNNLLPNPLEDYISETETAELAKQIGSKRPYVKRLLVAYRIYELIEEKDFFEITDLNETTLHFTYLMDSLNRPQIRDFIGIDLDSDNPLKKLREDVIDNLESLMKWFFEKKPNTRKPVMNGESGTLAMFCDVLANDKAFETFKEEEDLSRAYEKTLDPADNYRTSVNRGIKSLEESIIQLLHIPFTLQSDLEKAAFVVEIANKLKNDTSSKLK